MTEDARAMATLERHKSLLQERRDDERLWQRIRKFILPDSACITWDEGSTIGSRRHLFDNTAEQAAMAAAAGIVGMLTNAGSRWFSIETVDPALMQDRDVAVWLDQVEDTMLQVLSADTTRFQAANYSSVVSDVGFGNSCIYVEDRPGKLPLYHNAPIGQICIEEGADGLPDTIYREQKMRASVAYRRFGSAIGEKAMAAKDKNSGQQFTFLQQVMPAYRMGEFGGGSTGKNFFGRWINVDEKVVVREGGFEEQPYIYSRLWTNGDHPYGRGWGAMALDDTMMLQKMMEVNIVGGELTIRPPLMVQGDMLLQPLRMFPAAINPLRPSFMGAGGQSPISPILTGARPDVGEDMMDSVRGRIQEAFKLTLFRFVREKYMTATQALILDEERLRDLGPYLSQQQVEKFEPVLSRTYSILSRIPGILPPPPQVLVNAALRVSFMSPTAQQRRVEEARVTVQAYEAAALVAQAHGQEVYDNLDGDANTRHIVQRIGVGERGLRDPRAVAQMRQQRAEAMAQQAQMDQVEQAGRAAQSFGQAGASLSVIEGGGQANAA